MCRLNLIASTFLVIVSTTANAARFDCEAVLSGVFVSRQDAAEVAKSIRKLANEERQVIRTYGKWKIVKGNNWIHYKRAILSPYLFQRILKIIPLKSELAGHDYESFLRRFAKHAPELLRVVEDHTVPALYLPSYEPFLQKVRNYLVIAAFDENLFPSISSLLYDVRICPPSSEAMSALEAAMERNLRNRNSPMGQDEAFPTRLELRSLVPMPQHHGFDSIQPYGTIRVWLPAKQVEDWYYIEHIDYSRYIDFREVRLTTSFHPSVSRPVQWGKPGGDAPPAEQFFSTLSRQPLEVQTTLQKVYELHLENKFEYGFAVLYSRGKLLKITPIFTSRMVDAILMKDWEAAIGQEVATSKEIDLIQIYHTHPDGDDPNFRKGNSLTNTDVHFALHVLSKLRDLSFYGAVDIIAAPMNLRKVGGLFRVRVQ